MSDFGSFNLNDQLQRALREANILVPTNLQISVIPEIQRGRDVLIDADTGTGRTLAFAVPVFAKILDTEFRSRAVVLTTSQETTFSVENKLRRVARRPLPNLKIFALSSGIERTGARYEFFRTEEDFPSVLIGEPATVLHFVQGTSFDMERVDFLLVIMEDTASTPEFEDRVSQVAAKCRNECQRILITTRLKDPPYALLEKLLRSPSIIYDTAGGRRDIEAAQDGVQDRTPERRSEAEAIEHYLYMPLKALTADDLVNIVKAQWDRRTLVVVDSEEEAEDLQRQVRARIENVPVQALESYNRSDSLPAKLILLADVYTATQEKELLFNVVISKALPKKYENYLKLMHLLRGEPGDRIVSVGTSRDIGTLFNLRAAFGIRMKEFPLPSAVELQSDKETAIVESLARSAGKPQGSLLSLLRRIKASPYEERILAECLRRMLAATADPSAPAPEDFTTAPPAVVPSTQPERPARPSRLPRPRPVEGTKTSEPTRPSAGPRPGPVPRPSAGPKPSEGSAGTAEPVRPSQVPRPTVRPRSHIQNMAELKLNAGEKDGLDAGFLIQWLQSRLAMRVSEFGSVLVNETSSTILIPQDKAADAAVVLNDLKFNEKKTEVQVTPPKQARRK